jgi:hypothetical protein
MEKLKVLGLSSYIYNAFDSSLKIFPLKGWEEDLGRMGTASSLYRLFKLPDVNQPKALTERGNYSLSSAVLNLSNFFFVQLGRKWKVP